MEITEHPDHHYLIHATHFWIIMTAGLVSLVLVVAISLSVPNKLITNILPANYVVALNPTPIDPTVSSTTSKALIRSADMAFAGIDAALIDSINLEPLSKQNERNVKIQRIYVR